MPIQVMPLGAGCEVGRSCILAKINHRVIMFDCGLHVGFTDERRFPNFSLLDQRSITVDLIIISHFHMDHVGALAHFVAKRNYDGPILMTAPTKAITRLQLEDGFYINPDNGSLEDIAKCMEKITVVSLHEEFLVFPDVLVVPYYAGHVIGAAMFYVEVGGESVLYTGDFNTTPDRHLAPAEIPARAAECDVLITETTYCTTTRDSKRIREKEFIKTVSTSVKKGGKVLIPVFALGRAQELTLLLDSVWEASSMAGNVPILFTSSMAEKANEYYRMFVEWSSEYLRRKVRDSSNGGGSTSFLQFKHVRPLSMPEDNNLLKDNYNSKKDQSQKEKRPVVLLCTPGMLHTGTSLHYFKQWCENPDNTVIMPGYCVEGTVGHQVLNLKPPKDSTLSIGQKTYNVKCTVKNLSFSAHADALGVFHLIQSLRPKSLVLVHGNVGKMKLFKSKLENDFPKLCVMTPVNGVTVLARGVQYGSLEIPLSLSPAAAFYPPQALMSTDEEKKKMSYYQNSVRVKGKKEPRRESPEDADDDRDAHAICLPVGTGRMLAGSMMCIPSILQSSFSSFPSFSSPAPTSTPKQSSAGTTSTGGVVGSFSSWWGEQQQQQQFDVSEGIGKKFCKKEAERLGKEGHNADDFLQKESEEVSSFLIPPTSHAAFNAMLSDAASAAVAGAVDPRKKTIKANRITSSVTSDIGEESDDNYRPFLSAQNNKVLSETKSLSFEIMGPPAARKNTVFEHALVNVLRYSIPQVQWRVGQVLREEKGDYCSGSDEGSTEKEPLWYDAVIECVEEEEKAVTMTFPSFLDLPPRQSFPLVRIYREKEEGVCVISGGPSPTAANQKGVKRGNRTRKGSQKYTGSEPSSEAGAVRVVVECSGWDATLGRHVYGVVLSTLSLFACDDEHKRKQHKKHKDTEEEERRIEQIEKECGREGCYWDECF